MSGGLTATRLVGAAVAGSDGGKLGSIIDVVIAVDDGSVLYVVLATGGIMGVGEALFAVPWTALRADAEGGMSASFDAGLLAERPGFDKDCWPGEADPLFG